MKSRFLPDGSCQTCSGGWLCKSCQNDSAKLDRERSAVLRSTVAGIQQNRIYRVCARFELESDEMQTREKKALDMLTLNPSLA